jgi:hypothetical protein
MNFSPFSLVIDEWWLGDFGLVRCPGLLGDLPDLDSDLVIHSDFVGL